MKRSSIVLAGVLSGLLAFAVAASVYAKTDSRVSPLVQAVNRGEHFIVGVSTLQPVDAKASPFRKTFAEAAGLAASHNADVGKALGSGVMIDREHLLTHEAILNQGTSFRVRFSDGRQFEARAIGAAANLHLAILRVINAADLDLPKLSLAKPTAVLVGETAVALGNPYGNGVLARTGVVASRGLFEDRYLQTDIAMTPEVVGGGLIDSNGALLGINAWVPGGEASRGFVIPATEALEALNDLKRSEKAPGLWLGISIIGGKVTNVIPQSPAQQAGILPGDAVYGLDGQTIENVETHHAALRDAVAFHDSQKSLKLDTAREGKPRRFEISAHEFPLEMAQTLGRDLLGMDVLEINAETSRQYQLKAQQGVVIRRVVSGSPAEQLGLRAGDVLRQLGPMEVSSMTDFKKAVIQARLTASTIMLVQRQGISAYLAVSLQDRPSALI